MSTYAIGDIHGCLTSLTTVADFVGFKSSDTIVFLGDYIDRGPDSKGVIDWILRLSVSANVVTLRGNHELMMLEARHDPVKGRLWSSFYGSETLASYGVDHEADWTGKIPESHWRFMEQTRPYLQTETDIFVHGTLDADKPLVSQDPYALYWEKCREMEPHCSGKRVICGHTPHAEGVPGVYDFGVCIDTAACRGGWLTCFNPTTGEYWQASESKQTRKGSIENV